MTKTNTVLACVAFSALALLNGFICCLGTVWLCTEMYRHDPWVSLGQCITVLTWGAFWLVAFSALVVYIIICYKKKRAPNGGSPHATKILKTRYIIIYYVSSILCFVCLAVEYYRSIRLIDSLLTVFTNPAPPVYAVLGLVCGVVGMLSLIVGNISFTFYLIKKRKSNSRKT
jgi:hypothetical protein